LSLLRLKLNGAIITIIGGKYREARKRMKLNKSLFVLVGVVLLAGHVFAQDRSTGGLKGK